MEVFAQIIFWGSVLGLAHTYVFYPLLMRRLAAKRQANTLVYEPGDPELPVVCILMSLYNEERVIGDKLKSLLALNYPVEKLRLYIGSDCSSDNTAELVNAFVGLHPSFPVRFENFPQRRGKPPVINDLAALAGADLSQLTGTGSPTSAIFLLTDANVMLEPDTLYHLVKHFRNPGIGVVDAHMRGDGLRPQGISQSEARYMGAEVMLKHWESLAWGMMMGPFGGCYALRAKLFEPVPPNSLVDDFWIVFRVLEKGYAAINDLQAVCLEGATHQVSVEYRRKKRIAAGSFQNLARFRHWVLPPLTRLGFAFFSHKVLRWFGGFLLLGAYLSLGLLAGFNHFFQPLFWLLSAGATIVLALNFLQQWFNLKPLNPVKNLVYFGAMNIALIDGFFKWLGGIRGNTWQRTTRD